jgi:hypothetical protein
LSGLINRLLFWPVFYWVIFAYPPKDAELSILGAVGKNSLIGHWHNFCVKRIILWLSGVCQSHPTIPYFFLNLADYDVD